MNDITKIKVDGEPESSYQLYPRNEEFAKRAGGGDGGSGVQPDWNQNDDTKPDYVKNRPFYTGDPAETVLVEESTVSFAERKGRSLYEAVVSSTFKATVGETYKVSWDGTVYECTCVHIRERYLIGNLSIVGQGSDTGEPFIVGVQNGNDIQIGTKDTSASHTFSISVFASEVVKIDEKYLPTIPAPIYIIRKDSLFRSSATFEEVWELPPNVLASRLTLVFSTSDMEKGIGSSCREVTKANLMDRGKHIVATFAVLSALNNNTYDTEDYTIVWVKHTITQLTPNEGSITP